MTDIAVYDPNRLPIRQSATAGKLVDADVWTTYANIAATVAPTEFVPKDMRGKAPTVLACLLYGHDLGLGPMVALREITMIDGKPSLSAALVTARVRQDGHRMEWREILDDQGEFLGTTAYGERRDGSKGEFTFTLAMAKNAGLVREKSPWVKYPQAMCWARAATQLARMLFSDVFLGHATYMPEELGGEPDEDALSGLVIDDKPSLSSGEPQAGATAPVSPAVESEPASPDPTGPAPALITGTPVEPTADTEPGGSGASPFVAPEQKKPTPATYKLLNILVDRVCVQAKRSTKPELWAFVGIEPDEPEDSIHFSALREKLTMHQASELIDHLVTLEEFAIADGALQPRKGRAAAA